jgi:hypothetical protein
MATKAPYVVVLLISMLGVVTAAIVHGKNHIFKRALKGGLIAGGIMLLVALAIGWFYYNYNFLAYGNWVSAREPGYTGGREVRSLVEVLTAPSLWSLFYADLVKHALLSVAITSVAFAGFFTLKWRQIRSYLQGKSTRFVIPLLGLLLLGVFATQIEHADGVGAINFRYLLPGILTISLFLAYGLLAFKHARGLLLVTAVVAMGVSSLIIKEQAGILGPMTANGIPAVIAWVCLAMFGAGSIIFTFVMWQLSKKDQ